VIAGAASGSRYHHGMMRAVACAVFAVTLAAGCGCEVPPPDVPRAEAAPEDAPTGGLELSVDDWATIGSARAGWHARIRLFAFGRPGQWTHARSATPTQEGARVVLHRGRVDEWFEPSANGIEQGFTVRERPAGEGNLELAVEVEGLRVEPAGNAILLRDAAGRVRASYTDMHAHDATGRELGCRLRTRGNAILLDINDAGATYPLVVE
jgi:hypothetical protein